MAKREMKKREDDVAVVVSNDTAVAKEKKEDRTGSVEKGIVVDCSKLNIRKEPKKDAHIVSIIDAGAELKVIDSDKHKGEWYKVITANKVHGFCMKKYVKID